MNDHTITSQSSQELLRHNSFLFGDFDPSLKIPWLYSFILQSQELVFGKTSGILLPR